MSRITRTFLAISLVIAALPAVAEVTDEDVDRARSEVNRILSESQRLGDEVQRAWARQAELEHEIDGLSRSIDLAEVRLADTWRRLEEVAVEMYMGTTSGTSLGLIFSASGDEYEAGLEYLRKVSGADDSVIDELRIFTRELDRQRSRHQEASAEHVLVTADLQQMAEELQGDLVAAQQVYDGLVAQHAIEEERRRQEELRRREEEQRAREAAAAAAATTTTAAAATTSTAPPGTTTSTAPNETTTTATGETTTTTPPPAPSGGEGSCPVAGAASFSDTWGAPRSGGRTHQGVDMIATRGAPIVAVYAGTIKRITNSSLGGKSVWLRAGNGDEFYYAHLDDYGDISTGESVGEGHVIGYNGSTGNAPPWLPHLHFEFHPGGGAPVNPYPLVKQLCG